MTRVNSLFSLSYFRITYELELYTHIPNVRETVVEHIHNNIAIDTVVRQVRDIENWANSS